MQNYRHVETDKNNKLFIIYQKCWNDGVDYLLLLLFDKFSFLSSYVFGLMAIDGSLLDYTYMLT